MRSQSDLAGAAGTEEIASIRPLANRILRSAPYAIFAFMFWPILLLPRFRRPLEPFVRDLASLRDLLSARMAPRTRIGMRSIAYTAPMTASVFAGSSWEILAGITAYLGLLAWYGVWLLCQPDSRERLILLLVLGYWMAFLMVPVLVRD
jgi:hypothetical protein